MPISDNRGRPRRFIKLHNLKRFQQRGSKHPQWKGGRRKNGKYYMLWLPDYYLSDKNGCIYEHVYFYQEYNKCCLLQWGHVHHIIPIKKGGSNLPWNLQGMTKQQHARLHAIGNKKNYNKHKDTSDRICHICRSKITTMGKPNGKNTKTPYPRWHHLPWDKINWYCNKCTMNIRNKFKEGL